MEPFLTFRGTELRSGRKKINSLGHRLWEIFARSTLRRAGWQECVEMNREFLSLVKVVHVISQGETYPRCVGRKRRKKSGIYRTSAFRYLWGNPDSLS